MTKKELLKIIDSSYDILKEYCINSCNAYCCKSGFLRLNKNEAKIFTKSCKNKNNKNNNLVVSKKNNLIIISTHPSCIFLKNNKCKLFKNKNRPSICIDYPIKIVGNKNPLFLFHDSCKAVKQGILNDNIKKIRDLGYIVIC